MQIGHLKKGINPASFMDLNFDSRYLPIAIKTGIITGIISMAVSIYFFFGVFIVYFCTVVLAILSIHIILQSSKVYFFLSSSNIENMVCFYLLIIYLDHLSLLISVALNGPYIWPSASR